jgi:PII-like signaling protein
VIEFVDEPERTDAVLSLLDEMVAEGMVTVERVQIIAYRGSQPA